MYRAAIIGCGSVAQVHAAVLAGLAETALIACADVRPERARVLAEKYGCAAYDSLDALLAAEQPDCVHLCTPHYLHTPMAERLAEEGIAVFTEKPPVIDRAQWETLQRAAEKVRLGVCFQNRYNANVQALRALLQKGTYGAVLGARAFVTWQRGAAYYQTSGWRGDWATEGGGALINQSIHTLDLLIYLLGRPEKVETRMANHHLRGTIGVEDTVEAYLEVGGRPVLFYATTAYSCSAPVMLEVHCRKATLRLEGKDLAILTEAGEERRTFASPEPLGKGYWGNGHLPCISDFYASLGSGAPFRNGIAGVRDTVETLLTMYDQGRADLGKEQI